MDDRWFPTRQVETVRREQARRQQLMDPHLAPRPRVPAGPVLFAWAADLAWRWATRDTAAWSARLSRAADAVQVAR